MSGFGDSWKRAGEQRPEFDPPNGTYRVRVTDGKAWETQDGRGFAKLELLVLDGPHKDESFEDFMNLSHDVGARIAYENLAVYGVQVDTIRELEDMDTALLELTGTEATVSVRHSAKGYLNVTAQSVRTGVSDVPDDQEAFPLPENSAGPQKGRTGPYAADDDDEDIPFHHDEVPAWDDRYGR